MQGSSTLLTNSSQSVVEDGSHQQELEDTGEGDKTVAVDYRESIRTARNLAKVFSMEHQLQKHLKLSQDEFSMKIPHLLMEVKCFKL